MIQATVTQKEINLRKGFARRVVNRYNQLLKQTGNGQFSMEFSGELIAGGVGTRYTSTCSDGSFILHIAVTEYNGKQVAVLTTESAGGAVKFLSHRIETPDLFTLPDLRWKVVLK